MNLQNDTTQFPQRTQEAQPHALSLEEPAEMEESTPSAPISALVPSLSALALSFLTLHPVLLMATGGTQIHS